MQLTIYTINDDLLVLFYDVIFFFVTNFHANSSSLANCDEYENFVTENIYSVTTATSVTRKSSQMITSLLVSCVQGAISGIGKFIFLSFFLQRFIIYFSGISLISSSTITLSICERRIPFLLNFPHMQLNSSFPLVKSINTMYFLTLYGL